MHINIIHYEVDADGNVLVEWEDPEDGGTRFIRLDDSTLDGLRANSAMAGEVNSLSRMNEAKSARSAEAKVQAWKLGYEQIITRSKNKRENRQKAREDVGMNDFINKRLSERDESYEELSN